MLPVRSLDDTSKDCLGETDAGHIMSHIQCSELLASCQGLYPVTPCVSFRRIYRIPSTRATLLAW